MLEPDVIVNIVDVVNNAQEYGDILILASPLWVLDHIQSADSRPRSLHPSDHRMLLMGVEPTNKGV